MKYQSCFEQRSRNRSLTSVFMSLVSWTTLVLLLEWTYCFKIDSIISAMAVYDLVSEGHVHCGISGWNSSQMFSKREPDLTNGEDRKQTSYTKAQRRINWIGVCVEDKCVRCNRNAYQVYIVAQNRPAQVGNGIETKLRVEEQGVAVTRGDGNATAVGN